jgi:hypothetical protein
MLLSSILPGVPGLEEYCGSVVMVSFRFSVGISISFSSPTSGRVAFIDTGRSPPIFFAALSSAFLLFFSSSAIALLIL